MRLVYSKLLFSNKYHSFGKLVFCIVQMRICVKLQKHPECSGFYCFLLHILFWLSLISVKSVSYLFKKIKIPFTVWPIFHREYFTFNNQVKGENLSVKTLFCPPIGCQCQPPFNTGKCWGLRILIQVIHIHM